MFDMEIPLWEAITETQLCSAAQLYSHLSASRAVRSAVSSWLGDTLSRKDLSSKHSKTLGPWSIFIPDGLGIKFYNYLKS